ncbi:hypothetical protein OOK31_38360 [Streptomyces sp. NBC_00249]|uniref:hypothetical protein n=1 Tax=Streptomyces sp. NBC_00249 TaxID=2975690 RepID=UPI00225AA180|nr:hypothetical protein [Streptomyces sp. NBC_00249]MCX5199677.1 hypothetical protein [Streptomyces sp. NBC_00249]
MNDSPGWATPGSPSDGQGSDGTRPPAQPSGSGDGKWSATQPPPGQWAGPESGQAVPPQQQGPGWGSYAPQPGQYPGPQPGTPHGAPYGYPGAPGWGGPPPAAKPGVIPLRPLGLGEILDGAVSTLRGHWRSVLSVSLVIAALSQLAMLFVERWTMDTVPLGTDGTPPTASQTVDLMGDSLIVYGFQYYIEFLGLILLTALLAPVVSRAVLGKGSTLAGTLKAARPLTGQLLALTGLLLLGALAAGLLPTLPGILTGSIALTLLGIPVAGVLLSWFWVTFVLAPPALMLERGTALGAMKRSAKLVKGSWWRIFGISLLTGLIRGITAMIIAMPFAAIAVVVAPGGLDSLLDGSLARSWSFLIISAIGGVVGTTVTLPMQSGVTTLLYVDQRIRREALDLELARAAGQEG